MLHDMLTRKIGQSGIDASVVGLGTWAIGGWMWGGTNEAESIEAIRASIDVGVSLIDTAPAYGQGLSEEIVGKAIKGRRDQVVLATKCGLVWHVRKGNHFFDYDSGPVHRHLGRDSILYEVEKSLNRLGTDYIDLYITHWQDATTPIAETMEALAQLKSQGKIRAIGASNVSRDDLDTYLSVAQPGAQLDAIQEEYSMVKRDLEQTLLPTCIARNVATLSYSSLALGLLSGRIGPDRAFTGDDLRKDNPRFSLANRQKVQRLMDAIAPIAATHDATLAQIVIAWTLQQPGITFALCGARNAAQARENAAAGRIRLTAADLAAISDAAKTHLTNLDA
ncbi:aryl-alcohol dehydrogenase-like predicted oxidoreductase [Dongia mobilis]|uniref:Aryl-alcohol dehydrogenase-like predicted oxidoreductase n=1 Tax=Dongia mobilis TaxID=578943 RepID=A0A4R6WJB7_9PROT|nr:aldo/keto reductase [Dongia mobilis]TDQ80482.1 aryl-alcohol dehydrogenase-like predicted oxidoreductase [Dongia mobilis]